MKIKMIFLMLLAICNFTKNIGAEVPKNLEQNRDSAYLLRSA
jgi:hypothetical protein